MNIQIIELKKQFRELANKTVKDRKDRRRMFLALEKAEIIHKSQQRQSGDAYILHPISVAIDLQKAYGDPNLTIAGLLHDVVEDGENVNLKKVCRTFGKDVCFLVDSVTKTILHYEGEKKMFNDKLEKTLWGGMKDVRALLLKLHDRENNLSDLENLMPHKQIRMSFETQAIYFPVREILKTGKTDSIAEIESVFKKFLEDNKIENENEFKDFLFQKSYLDFNKHIYDIVYKNSDKIIWTVSDVDFCRKLCQNDGFDISSRNVCFHYDGRNFRADFIFKKGFVIEKQEAKFELTNFHYSS